MGRNIWKTDLGHALNLVEHASAAIGSDRVLIAPSCSLLHTPADLDAEKQIDDELREWLAFAKQKLEESNRVGTRSSRRQRRDP